MNQPQNIFQTILFLVGFILLMALGGELVTRGVPAVNRRYRAVLAWTWNGLRGRIRQLFRWAWREYKQFIVGVGVGVLLTLYFTGRLG